MKYFSVQEFLKSAKAKSLGIDMSPSPLIVLNIKSLVENVLDPLREEIKSPLIITSGYRPVSLNRAIGGSLNSQHVKGEAADFSSKRYSPAELCAFINSMGLEYDQLINEFDSWVHVSFKRLGRNRGEYLKATKRNGKTFYDILPKETQK